MEFGPYSPDSYPEGWNLEFIGEQWLGLAHFVRLTRAERPRKVRWTFRSEEPGGALAFSMRF